MRDFIDPLREIRESMRVLQQLDPLQGLRESMRASQQLDQLRQMRESMNAAHQLDPLREMRATMRAIQRLDPLRELRESMRAIQQLDTLRELRESMRTIQQLDPLREMRESMKALQQFDPLREMRESMRAIHQLSPLREIEVGSGVLQLREALSGLRELASAISLGVKLNKDPSLTAAMNGTLDADTEDWDDVGSEDLHALAGALSRLLDARSGDLADAVRAVAQEINSLRSNRVQRLLSTLIMPLLVGALMAVVNPIAQIYIEEVLQQRREREAEAAEIIVGSAANRPDLANLRIVWASDARVWSRPRRNSPSLGHVSRGQIVALIERRKRWSLICFFDQGRVYQGYGWIRSKQLKSIPK